MSTKSTVPEQVQLTRIPTCTGQQPPPMQQQPSFDREGFLRRSLTLTSKADRANLIHSLTERISQRMNNAAVQPPTARVVSTHHVIPVNLYYLPTFYILGSNPQTATVYVEQSTIIWKIVEHLWGFVVNVIGKPHKSQSCQYPPFSSGKPLIFTYFFVCLKWGSVSQGMEIRVVSTHHVIPVNL